MNDTQTPTLGMRRVRLDFNPSGNATVSDIKQSAADFIDLCHRMADKTKDPEVGRCIALAMTHAEDAVMWAVKAATAPSAS